MLVTATNHACPSEESLVVFLRGNLPGPAHQGTEAHLAACAACRALVSALAKVWTFPPEKQTGTVRALSVRGGNQVLALAKTEAAPFRPLPVRLGAVILGKYRVEEVLGVGGMGMVVRATHLALKTSVALKFLLPGVGAPERFLREARAAARLESEHVARVLDVGSLEDGIPFIVMEYLCGHDLSEVLAERGPFEVREATELMLQACAGLEEAHALGIVHRDLKPSNLFLTRKSDGRAHLKVLDFGISKVPDESGVVTTDTALLGSPRYMSPEQMQNSKTVDHRTDVWALGLIYYELLSGIPAFDADTLPGVCAVIMTAPAPRIRSLRPEVPKEVEAIILQALEKDPEKRTRSVRAFTEALLSLRPEGRARSPWVAWVLPCLVLLVLGGFALSRVGSPPRAGASLPPQGSDEQRFEKPAHVEPLRGAPAPLGPDPAEETAPKPRPTAEIRKTAETPRGVTPKVTVSAAQSREMAPAAGEIPKDRALLDRK